MIPVIKDVVHAHFLEAKRLRHYVFSSRFEKAIANASKEQLDKLTELVKKGALDGIREYIEQLLNSELESMCITKLRVVARQYRIKEYYMLTKTQLVQEIKNAQERYSAGSA